ncbi:MAG TPA: hypothetical protein VK190_10175 [Pseudoneobacillus sp.]|nr:hypothetical protein [Pseudoneobacillus sp.]
MLKIQSGDVYFAKIKNNTLPVVVIGEPTNKSIRVLRIAHFGKDKPKGLLSVPLKDVPNVIEGSVVVNASYILQPKDFIKQLGAVNEIMKEEISRFVKYTERQGVLH